MYGHPPAGERRRVIMMFRLLRVYTAAEVTGIAR